MPIKKYYSLTKPGVLYGNVLTTVAGFLLAAGYFKAFDLKLFIATVVGTTFVIASACVLNNYLDQDIDSVMQRTKTRALASGEIPGWHALIMSVMLVVAGIVILALWVNWLVVSVGVFGFIVYVWLYGAFSKRKSIHGTLVGSISGATPIFAGYIAVSDQIDLAAILLFLMLFFWQFPEFYSIAIYRRDEYKKAGIPVMSVVKGTKSTKTQIFIYTVAFVVAALLLTPLGYTGYIYFIVMALLGIYWIWLGAKGLKAKNSNAWARKMFHFSLINLLALCLMLAVGAILP